MNFNNPLRTNGNDFGILVEVFFIPRLNALAPPSSAVFHIFDLNPNWHLQCAIECIGFTNFVRTTVIWKIFTVELFSFCAIINEIKLLEFFSTTDN